MPCCIFALWSSTPGLADTAGGSGGAVRAQLLREAGKKVAVRLLANLPLFEALAGSEPDSRYVYCDL
jgi:hypothetical protein